MRDLRRAARSRDAGVARATAARSSPRRVRRCRARPVAHLARARDVRATAIRVRRAPRRAQGARTRALRDARLAPLGDGTAPMGRAPRHRPGSGAWADAALDARRPGVLAGPPFSRGPG